MKGVYIFFQYFFFWLFILGPAMQVLSLSALIANIHIEWFGIIGLYVFAVGLGGLTITLLVGEAWYPEEYKPDIG